VVFCVGGEVTLYNSKTVAVVVPAFREELQIGNVLSTMPQWVDYVFVVDDASPAPDTTFEIAMSYGQRDHRVRAIRRPVNGGVGAAIETGYIAAIEVNAQIVCVMAGDGQMDPDDLEEIVKPVACGRADYSKANRLSLSDDWKIVPTVRLFGNIVLSFLTRFSTGYWNISDAQSGFTAASNELVKVFIKRGIYPRYGVPNDLLVKCSVAGSRVVDVPTRPRYGVGEQSKLKPRRVALPILWILIRGFVQRVFVRYIVKEANPVPIAYLSGFLSFTIGLLWSAILITRSIQGKISSPEAIAASLLFVGGSILITLAVVLDVLFCYIVGNVIKNNETLD